MHLLFSQTEAPFSKPDNATGKHINIEFVIFVLVKIFIRYGT